MVLRIALLPVAASLILCGLAGLGCRSRSKPPVQSNLPLQGLFQRIGPMIAARYEAAAVRLDDGRVLITTSQALNGDQHPSWGSTELFDPATQTFYALPSFKVPRVGQALVALPDGSVLAVGGLSVATWKGHASIERYDPGTGCFDLLPVALAQARSDAKAVLLQDGRILILHGLDDQRQPCPTAEILNLAKGRCAVVGKPVLATRQDATVTRLQDGRVLIAGGRGPDQQPTAQAELFEPGRDRFRALPNLGFARARHTATVLADGRVLLAGGCRSIALTPGGTWALEASAELFNPTINRFLPTLGGLNWPRFRHSATLLKDGRVLILGGFQEDPSRREGELFDPGANSFSAGPVLTFARDVHTAVALADGRVLVLGRGNNVAELLN